MPPGHGKAQGIHAQNPTITTPIGPSKNKGSLPIVHYSCCKPRCRVPAAKTLSPHSSDRRIYVCSKTATGVQTPHGVGKAQHASQPRRRRHVNLHQARTKTYQTTPAEPLVCLRSGMHCPLQLLQAARCLDADSRQPKNHHVRSRQNNMPIYICNTTTEVQEDMARHQHASQPHKRRQASLNAIMHTTLP